MSKVYTYYYFVGVGGIGMSAIARFFKQMGKEVWGYDKTASPLTNKLQAEGIDVTFNDDPSLLDSKLLDKERTLVVYTPAIPVDNAMLHYFEQNGFDVFKRSKVLGMITEDTVNLSIAGTHGKTTTSCMLAAIFKASDKKFSAFLGGISTDLASNYYHQEGEGEHFTITEADEYDRSFLHLSPSLAAITSTDSDHLDVYGEAEEVKRSFQEFADKLNESEALYLAKNKTSDLKGHSYSSMNPAAEYYSKIVTSNSRGTFFDLRYKGESMLGECYLNIPGIHNVENATAAILLAMRAGIDMPSIKNGLANFQGIKRRFEYVLEKEDLVYIDDYAHHPSELDSIIGSIRELYPNKQLTVVFQPHLYSRTRDFVDGFASSLSKADRLVLLPIYPAREMPIAGVTSEIILQKTTLEDSQLVEKEQLLEYLSTKQTEVLLTVGAGDIDRLVEPIKQLFNG